MALNVSKQADKGPNLQVNGATGSTLLGETWTLTNGLRGRLDWTFLWQFSYDASSGVVGKTSYDPGSARPELDRIEIGTVTCLIRERQLHFCGHVVHFPEPEDDPAH